MTPNCWQGDFFHCYSTSIIPARDNSHWDEQELGVRHRPSRAKRSVGKGRIYPTAFPTPAKPLRWGAGDASVSICSPWGRPRLTPASSCLPRDAQHPRDQPLPPWELGYFPPADASAV